MVPEGHEARDIYQTLVAADPPAPEEVLKAALLNRAMTDVRRIMRMRDDKQALGTLLQKGSIGDETMARFTLAEKELEAEILDVVSEANTFREGWGQLIFPSASEMVAHLKHKEIYYDIQRQRAAEVKKLEDEGKPVPKANVELPPLVTPPGTKIEIPGGPAVPAVPEARCLRRLRVAGSERPWYQPAYDRIGTGCEGDAAQRNAAAPGAVASVDAGPTAAQHAATAGCDADGGTRTTTRAPGAGAGAGTCTGTGSTAAAQPADANKENDQTPAAAPTEAKTETPAAPSTKTATVEDGDDA